MSEWEKERERGVARYRASEEARRCHLRCVYITFNGSQVSLKGKEAAVVRL